MLVDEEYIEEFMKNLPKDKVVIIEENFEENKALLHDAFESFKQNTDIAIPFAQTMKNVDEWFQKRVNQ
jgi:beta-mannanase